jgi:hypothetical protein
MLGAAVTLEGTGAKVGIALTVGTEVVTELVGEFVVLLIVEGAVVLPPCGNRVGASDTDGDGDST